MLHHTRGSVCAAIATVAIFLTGLTLGNAQQPDAGGYRSYRSPSRENEFGGAGSRSFVRDTSRTPQSGRYRYDDVDRNPYSSIRPGTNSANNAGYRSGYQSADRRPRNLQNTFRNRAQNFGDSGGENRRSFLKIRQRMKIVKAGRRTRSADRAATDPGIDRSTTAYSGFDDRGRYDGRRRDARQLRSPSSSRPRPPIRRRSQHRS